VPAEDTVYVDTYSPYLNQYETDDDSQFTLNLPMNYFEEIGTNTGVASGTNASIVWSDLLLGKEYEWFVEVTDATEHTQVGPTWSFTTIDNPQQASNPSPENEATGVDIDADLSWTAGASANTHDVYFGTSYTAVEEAIASIICPEYKGNQTGITFDPGILEEGVTYYWRIDEKNLAGTTAGTVWSFTTSIQAPETAEPNNPINPDGTAIDVPDVKVGNSLCWFSGDRAASHDVYFGTSFDGVNNANNGSSEFQCNILQQYGVPVGDDVLFTWNPGAGDLPYDTSYYWRIDEINPGGVTKGDIWNFITETDTYPPIFTYLWVGSITAHEATIGWTTNELSDSTVVYGLNEYNEEEWELVYDSNEVTSHSVTLTGLQPGKVYYFRATSTDQAEPGNSANMEGSPFTTLPNTAPVAVDDGATTTEGTAVVIDVLSNDSDYDGDTLTVESVTYDSEKAIVDINPDHTVTYTPILAAPYNDTFQYTINDGYFGTDTAIVTVQVSEPYVDYTANGEIAVSGTVTNDYTYTWESENDYEAIEEAISGGGQPKNLRSSLEHKWIIDVIGGDTVTFYVEAYHTVNSEGDDFVFAYSTDDVTYTDMLTVTKIADDDTYQTYSLPSSISGTVYIRVQDTDDSRGNGLPDMIYVDHMFIRRSIIVAPPGQVSNPSPSDGAQDVAVSVNLSWAAGNGAESHDVYFGTTNPPPFIQNQAGTSYDPGTLANEATYYWRIDGVNGFGITTGAVWSFTTKPAGGLNEVYVNDIAMSSGQAGKNYYALATVWIKDDTGADVEGATVYGDWSGDVSSTVSGVTGTDGKVTLRSPNNRNGGTFTFTVTDVVASGYTYNPNHDNALKPPSGTITAP
jgi:hypothetical protein